MRKLIFLMLFVLAYFHHTVQNEGGFEFVESSMGMDDPRWESGKTELEFADINMDGYLDILSIGDHGCPGSYYEQSGIMKLDLPADLQAFELQILRTDGSQVLSKKANAKNNTFSIDLLTAQSPLPRKPIHAAEV
ncbi:MAG: hypothetical protein U5Q03_10880 [Bacteroidota bacterium]|nr:hypothetical protein [Bacteroidota bacterium]